MREANQSLAQASSEKLPAEAGESTGPQSGTMQGRVEDSPSGIMQGEYRLSQSGICRESTGLTVRHYAESQHSALKRMSPSNPSCRVQETLQERRHKECKSQR